MSTNDSIQETEPNETNKITQAEPIPSQPIPSIPTTSNTTTNHSSTMTTNQRIATRADLSVAAIEHATNASVRKYPSRSTSSSSSSSSANNHTHQSDDRQLRNSNDLSPSTSKSPPNAVRKIPKLGELSKQQYLLVLKDKLAAISRHLRRFDAAIALVRAQESKRKSDSTQRNRTAGISAGHRKLYQQVRSSQHRHDVLVQRRANRKKLLKGKKQKKEFWLFVFLIFIVSIVLNIFLFPYFFF
jgi:hypothetical protein